MADGGETSSDGGGTAVPAISFSPNKGGEKPKDKEKTRVSKTSAILWHAHQNDPNAVRRHLKEDRSLVNARDYDYRTPLHVASLHGWVDVAKCLIEYGADVNAQDRWKNTVCFCFFLFSYIQCFLFMCWVHVSALFNAME